MPISGANFTPLDHFFLRNRSSNGIKGSRQSYASREANLCSWVEQSGHSIRECVSTFSYLLARGGLGNSKLYRPHVCRTCLSGEKVSSYPIDYTFSFFLSCSTSSSIHVSAGDKGRVVELTEKQERSPEFFHVGIFCYHR